MAMETDLQVEITQTTAETDANAVYKKYLGITVYT